MVSLEKFRSTKLEYDPETADMVVNKNDYNQIFWRNLKTAKRVYIYLGDNQPYVILEQGPENFEYFWGWGSADRQRSLEGAEQKLWEII